MNDDEREIQRIAKAKAHAERARRSTAVNVKSVAPPPRLTPKATEIWREPDSWPRDPVGYVFLARAVGDIGRVFFGDEWTGNEAPASLPDTSSYPYQRIHSPSESEKATEARFEKVQDTIAVAAEAKQLLTAGRAPGRIHHAGNWPVVGGHKRSR